MTPREWKAPSAFIGMAFAFSWVIWTPAVLVYHAQNAEGLPAWALLAGLSGAYGPSVAALAATGFENGKRGVAGLLGKLLVWRAGVWWYAAVLLTIPLLHFASLGLAAMMGRGVGPPNTASALSMALMAFALALPFGPLGEELGWRGYLLPRLQERYGALASSLILGTVWTFWHTPIFWFPGAALGPNDPVNAATVGLYWLNVVGTAILFTWVFNNTGGSVLLVILFHASVNASSNFVYPSFPEMTAEAREWAGHIFTALKWVLIAGVVVYFGPARLSRRRQPGAAPAL